MDLVHPRCAGADVSKRDAKVCVRVAGRGRAGAASKVTTWGSFTNQVLALREHLISEQVSLVVMEAAGDYWKPFYYLLEDGPFEVMLVNARHVKNLPGRKSDVPDAAWLAQLGAHGLVRGSFVPPEPIRQLRDLTRTRTAIVRERGREIQRLEKLLEDAGIKLSSVAADITGVSGRAMLEALAGGQHDPAALADLARRRLRSKIPQLSEALTGRFTQHHAFLTIAETGADMTRFPTAGHLASWAGTCPGSNESAGRVKSAHTRPGNPCLKGALGIAAMPAARSNGTCLSAKYRRIASRRGPVKAIVAVEHAILIAIWNMITNGAFHDDPGSDFYTRRNPDKTRQRAIDQLRQMGYAVTLEPLKTAAAQ